MRIINAVPGDLPIVQNIVYETINAIYPSFYPQEVVDFFIEHHDIEKIENDICSGKVYLGQVENRPVGTATIDGNHIDRVFVLPTFQGKGYGTKLMDFCEKEVAKKFTTAAIDSSLPAYGIYGKRGYIPKTYEKIVVRNGRVLCFHSMEKQMCSMLSGTSYNGKCFKAISNTDNGEVSDETLFFYRQSGDMIWADYFGGSIRKGFLVGIVTNSGNLEFIYAHLNNDKEMRSGKCTSKPEILPDGRIRLHETWQWFTDDRSCGSSVIEEMASNSE